MQEAVSVGEAASSYTAMLDKSVFFQRQIEECREVLRVGNLSSDKSNQSICDKKPRWKPGLVWSEEAPRWLRGSSRPALQARSTLFRGQIMRRVQTIWNLRDAATANFRH